MDITQLHDKISALHLKGIKPTYKASDDYKFIVLLYIHSGVHKGFIYHYYTRTREHNRLGDIRGVVETTIHDILSWYYGVGSQHNYTVLAIEGIG